MESINISDLAHYNKFISAIEPGKPLEVQKKGSKEAFVILTKEDYEKFRKMQEKYEEIEQFQSLLKSLDKSHASYEKNGGYTHEQVKNILGVD